MIANLRTERLRRDNVETKQFFAASRLIIVAGKGGVGKTTVSATLALCAANAGANVVLVELEGRSSLPSLFGVDELAFDDTPLPLDESVPGSIRARTITADASLVDYLDRHGLKRISNRMASAGVVEIVSTATPGLRDLLVLGKIRQIQSSDPADVIIVDAPAAGHAVSFLRSPKGISDTVSVGALQTQAQEILDMLGDPSRCSVVLTALPEETPINELIDTAYLLEDEVGVMLGPLVLNGWWNPIEGLSELANDTAPLSTGVDTEQSAAGLAVDSAEMEGLAAAASYRVQREALQAEQLDRLTTKLPLPVMLLPRIFSTRLGYDDLATLAAQLDREIQALPDAAEVILTDDSSDAETQASTP